MRYPNIGAVAVAFLLRSMMSVAMLSTRADPTGMGHSGDPVPQPPLESWYFAAQYVNQATGLEEPIQEYDWYPPSPSIEAFSF